MRFFKKTKWEFRIAQVNNYNSRDIMDKLQKDGWEVSGSSSTHYHGSPTNQVYMYIPLKRRLRKEPNISIFSNRPDKDD